MKYSIKLKINKQINVNEGKKDKDGISLPQQLELVSNYRMVTDVSAPDDRKFTVSEIMNDLRSRYPVSPSIDEKLIADGVELTNPSDEVSARKLEYSITSPYVESNSNH